MKRHVQVDTHYGWWRWLVVDAIGRPVAHGYHRSRLRAWWSGQLARLHG